MPESLGSSDKQTTQPIAKRLHPRKSKEGLKEPKQKKKKEAPKFVAVCTEQCE
ncbi:5628_t:CDS:2, partial [Dentiscutata erythropus]